MTFDMQTFNYLKIARKDICKSPFHIWEQIFQAPQLKNVMSSLQQAKVKVTDLKAYMNNALIRDVEQHGDIDKILQGLA